MSKIIRVKDLVAELLKQDQEKEVIVQMPDEDGTFIELNGRVYYSEEARGVVLDVVSYE